MTVADGFYRRNSADQDKKLATSVDDATGWNTLYVKIANPLDIGGSSGQTDAQFAARLPFAVTIASMPSTPVTGVFWQSTQPVSIASPVAVTIASMPSTPVTGTFWQLTQPVSLTSLPLPSNAATESGNLATIAAKDFATAAKQDTGNTSLSIVATLGATSAKQDTTNTALALLATAVLQTLGNVLLDAQAASQRIRNAISQQQLMAALTNTPNGFVPMETPTFLIGL